MAYRNKTYVAFDADNDIHYYRLMCAWRANDNTDFNFHDAHDINNLLPTSSEETIKRKLRERFANAKRFVVLVGSNTRFLYRFVRWEMEQALDLQLPIVAVNLNGRRSQDSDLCPPIIRDALCMHVSFNLRIVQHAMDNWPDQHHQLRREGKSGPYFYTDDTYRNLGIH